ncbi:MAG TPA: DUF6328 family protein [Stellaceae bacterium]|jgi:hypothetical protein|nr:DUF6328 family protein [Stellaceae bacterium]
MELGKKTKIALDETRMLILGAQILLGFQFRSAFQDGFETLPAPARYLDALALGFMVFAVGLLIAPGPYHRIVEAGKDSGPFHRVICWYADLALLPFALGLGLDLAVTVEQIFGHAAAVAAGGGAALLALLSWYALPQLRKQSAGAKERAKTMRERNKRQQTPLTQKIEQMLTEARVILPGAQAMLGFQLAIVLTKAFEQLPSELRLAHAVSLGLISLAVILLMTPAAYHRIVFEGEDAPEMHRVGSILVTAATVPLALGLAGDVYVVIAKIGGDAAGIAAALAALVLLFVLWYAVPLAARWWGAGAAGRRYSASPAE